MPIDPVQHGRAIIMCRRTADHPAKSHHKSKHRIRQQQNDDNISFLLQHVSLNDNATPSIDNNNNVSTFPAVADNVVANNDMNRVRIHVQHREGLAAVPLPYEQKRCHLFLKALIRLIGLQLLEQQQRNGNSPSRYSNKENLLRQIKSIIHERILQNRTVLNKNKNNMPSLQEIIILHVRNIIGIEYYWNITREYLGYDCF